MARKYYWKRRRSNQPEDPLPKLIALIGTIFVIALAIYISAHLQEAISWLFTLIVIFVVGVVAYKYFNKFKHGAALGLDDDKLLYMLKGMSPAQYETEVAKMFDALGYRTEVVGGANDGGIDIVAHKDGKKYFVQCKKFITREVTPHDVRDFLGAITNANNPADQGFFVTTGVFTLMAKEAAKGNPRIELIDGLRLIEYYKMAHGQNMPEENPVDARPRVSEVFRETQSPGTCPRCRGELVLRTAKHGERAGKQFWGCSNFAKTDCTFTENVQ